MARLVKLGEADILKPIDQKRREEIAAGLKREFDFELNVPAEEWGLLEGLLHHFQRSFIDWDGYLNKGEISKVSGIAKKAAKLSLAIEQAKQLGLGDILEYELAPITFDQLFSILALLSKIDPRSPKSSDEQTRGDMRYQDSLKADLQIQLDEWWSRKTRSPTATEESEVTPYTYFLAQIFKTLPLELAKGLGSSRTAVNERRRQAARRQARKREISEAFKKLNSLKPPADD